MTDITYGALSRMRPRTPREKARDAALAQSVMSRSSDEWQPEYQREPGLESPMISPEDLLLMGGPSALKAIGSALRSARLLGGKSGAIPISEFERNVANFKPRKGERTLYHATDIPWEGSSPRPGTWFSTEPPRSGNPFGNTVRAYSVPEEMLSGAKLPRGKGFQDSLATGSEPVAIVDEGGGLTSYVVRDPSVLKRLEVKRSLSPSPVSGSPRAQVGALSPEEAYKVASEYASSLKGKQREALSHYTDTTSPLHAFQVNTALRNNETSGLEDYIATLDEILRNAPKSDTQLTVFRGAPKIFGKQKGYTSTTIDPDVAFGYAEDFNNINFLDELAKEAATKHKLLLPEKSPLVNPDVNRFWEDAELLLPRGISLTPRKTGDVDVSFKRGGLVQMKECNCGR